MGLNNILVQLNRLKANMNRLLEAKSIYKNGWKENLIDSLRLTLTSSGIEMIDIADDLATLYEKIVNIPSNQVDRIVRETKIDKKVIEEIQRLLPLSYGRLRVKYEDYKLKSILWYEDNEDNDDKYIVYMAGSFYTDQEYRTFLANIQKGINNITYYYAGEEYNGEYHLRTIKDGYISRVKKALNQNTQDGYHATFQLDNGRFFILRDDDSPVDRIYDWIVANTQAGVLEEWKTYLYNQLVEGGYIIECKGIDYTGINIKGIVLSDEVNTEVIRNIRYEGLSLEEIKIPREPVELDDNMTFLEVMNQFIIPEINAKETLYKVGDPFSPLIETPIISKQGCKLKKTRLYPKQKVMTQGLLNAVKDGKHSLFLNGGMGVGKTYMSIKFSYAVIKEHFKRDNGRIAVFCQGHLIPKWKRQFKEALPDVKLKFIQINSYKDVIELKDGKPEGIEVYLLPKDKVKRKYLEEYAANKYRFKLSNKATSLIRKYNGTNANIIKANKIKMSELKVVARTLERLNQTWICTYKEVMDKNGNIVEYKVATTSKTLKSIYGTTKKL